MSRNLNWREWIFAGAILFIFTVALYWLRVINLQDESWFLWITKRFKEGDVPYRDFFLGVLPLPLWVTFVMSQIVGVHLFAIRLINSFAFAVTVVWACFIFARVSESRRFPKWLAVANMLMAMPSPSAPYELLAYMFVMSSLAAIVEAQGNKNEHERLLLWFALSGLSCGLAFVCKHNLGVYALVALVLSAIFMPIPIKRKLQTSIVAALTFGLVVFLAILPVFLSGSWEAFWDYVFANKTNYLKHGRVSFAQNLSDLVRWLDVLFSQPSHEAIRHVTQLQVSWLPVLASIALLVIFGKRNKLGEGVALTVAFHVALSVLALYPHAGRSHILHAVPFYLLGIFCAAFALRTEIWFKTLWKLRHVAKCMMLFLLAFTVSFLLLRVQKGTLRPVSFPPFKGMLVRSSDLPQILRDIESLKSYGRRNREIFLMFPKAGFFYLTTGLRNPTPYDIPSPTAVGLNGEKKIIDAIKQGEIKAVVLPKGGIGLKKAEAFIRANMVTFQELNIGTLYELPSPATRTGARLPQFQPVPTRN